jgi:isoleucyl-tRNA synthetase
VAVIDTDLTDDLRAEGDARELTRAVQELRKEAGLALDDRIELWVAAEPAALVALEPYLADVADDVLADDLQSVAPPPEARTTELDLSVGRVRVGVLRRPRTDG